MKYRFSINNQSPWLVDVYNSYLNFKSDGFLVEVGVGHTLDGTDYINENTFVNRSNFTRCCSNTADMLDLGWNGIYIDPVKEYCEEAKLAHSKNLDRLQIINLAVSDKKEELKMYLGDTLIPNKFDDRGYAWIGRTIKCMPLTEILNSSNCPNTIDLMSIDVEGFELKVLNSLDFNQYSIRLLVSETNQVNKKDIQKVLPESYIEAASDYLNTVWVNMDHKQ